ncbi:MAG: acyltransferase [Calditrichae bacterium]|nr:acyltransferase [Calditrichia bacterium]
MINPIVGLYNIYQSKQKHRRLYTNAVVGDNIELRSGFNIHNESGDKNKIVIGNNCMLDGSIVSAHTGLIEIANFVWIEVNTRIIATNHIKIGNYVGIAEGVVIIDNNTHPTDPEERVKHRMRVAPGGPGYGGLGGGYGLADSKPIIIEDVTWIGSYSVILKGITIGEGSIVARNSIVTKDVPPYTIVAGNPAKVVKTLKKPDHPYFKV